MTRLSLSEYAACFLSINFGTSAAVLHRYHRPLGMPLADVHILAIPVVIRLAVCHQAVLLKSRVVRSARVALFLPKK